MKILLIEDHADSAEILLIFLRRMGHTVSWAGSCEEAMERFERESFDLAICDVTLPDGDGCDLFIKLKEVYSIPGVVLTGHLMLADIVRYHQAGFEQVIHKPFVVSALRAAIETIGARLQAEAHSDSEFVYPQLNDSLISS